jgi:hypothetical protein
MTRQISIKELSIERFKLFKNVKISNLGNINVITGKNNGGKTSLLEALFLCLGPANPELWLNIFGRRGVIGNNFNSNLPSYLFHKLDMDSEICFQVVTNQGEQYKLYISKQDTMPKIIRAPEKSKFIDPGTKQVLDPSNTTTLKIVFSSNKQNKQIETFAIISKENISFVGSILTIFNESFFLSSTGATTVQNDAARYTIINKQDKIKDFEDTLRIIEPNLIRTSLIIEENTPYVAGDVGYGLVPLPLLGQGMNKLSSILLSLASSNKAVCLIDEIENGFHYSTFEKVWESIYQFSKFYQCQVFVTTHSLECLIAAKKIFISKGEEEFKLHKLVQKGDDIEFFTFDKDLLSTALDVDWDIR